MTKKYPMYLAGEWVESDHPLEITNPYNGEAIGQTWLATGDQLEQSIVAAEHAFAQTRVQPVYERVQILDALAEKMKQHRDEIASLIAMEAGKPIRDAEVEADRGIFTVQVASEEAKRIEGDVVPLDLLPSSKGRFGIVRRFPIGLIAGISPFNFPLNLALHKVAPAIASGNPIVLKPPSRDPLVMLLIARLLDEIGIVPGSLSVLPMDREVGNRMVEDERFKLLSFTGSPDVGWEMKQRSGMKQVVLELGGNAGVIVDEDADIAFAAQRVRVGAFAYAGQVCISVQRVFVHERVYDTFIDALVQETSRIKLGDPLDRDTDVGPMIDDKAAARSQQWIEDAVAQGANALVGGKAEGRFMQPTIIENAPKDAFVCSREAFAPLVTVFKVPTFGKAVEAVNDSVFGLQAGVFTNNLERGLYAYENIEAGGVVLNDIPTYRIDHMPYGGVKSSGLSREGIRYAIEDMTEMRLLVVNRLESQRVID
ncbi:MAG: aldehyde dehydrogenase family protein [Thermomicrobiales bacterium]|nr:aldehyde dehydrogenase family protein [Thermomicrobiales bacterium]